MADDVKVRYAVVAAGWISQSAFMPGVKHTDNSQITALVTGDPEKAKALASLYEIPKTYTYEQYDEMLTSGEVDAVYLATPNPGHVDLAVKTLNAGLHLLLEKPMAVSVQECERIIAAAAAGKTKLMIAYRLHFEPTTLDIIERVRAGEIGTPRCFTSTFIQHVAASNHRAKNGFWAGPVADMGPYPINAVRNIFGAEPIEVYATGTQAEQAFNFHDTVAVTLKFEGDRTAQFTVSYAGEPIGEYHVGGTSGWITTNPAYTFHGAIEAKRSANGKKAEEKGKETDQFGGETRYFSECILDGRMPEPDGEEGLRDVRVIAAVEESLRTGQVVKLPPMQLRRGPVQMQVMKLSPVKAPELVNAFAPEEG
ncbi:MAG TPA: Gfo/Idh/MocA family oxidoreductase [Acidobacteriaceae bacterium]